MSGETTALARRFKVDIDTNWPATPPVWNPLLGITDFKPGVAPTLQDASDYDNDGWVGQEKTQQAWTATATYLRKKNQAGQFPVAQEYLRAAEDQFGDEARAHIRWYDRDGGDEAYEGYGIVGLERANSGVTDLDAVTATITGDGARTPIANPLA
ncbi:phage tail tube protein [Dactylosporangium salmoneum]|uniref:Uncharacterized protein n=1 Tax=Dactylosporangium salmoneum TaxID=53361 RepID=A0ABP5SCT9_9ACTN